jgi:hypothetical protein
MNSMRSWLESHNLGEYADAFDRNRIDLSILREISERDLNVRLSIPRARSIP